MILLRRSYLGPLCTSFLIFNLLCAIDAAELTPARGHYEKLGRLEAQPSAPNLPLDQQRFATNPAFVEKVQNLKQEFIRIPLDEIKLPACPANSSQQTTTCCAYKSSGRKKKANVRFISRPSGTVRR